MKTKRLSFDDLDLVVQHFDLVGVNGAIAVVENFGSILFQGFGNFGHR